MPRFRLLLSFDHELSLGGSSSYQKDLFAPTDRLLRLASDLDVPITLFADVCCAIRFRDWDKASFFEPFVGQLQRAVREGHDVQLHLHPHWLDSEFRGGRFVPSASYSLGSFAHRTWPDNIPGIVERGVGLLREICVPADRGYRCVAFRAGGFCLSPGTDSILSALYHAGIRIDSSVAKGNRFASRLWSVDHRDMPQAANWFIDPAGPINTAAADGLFEIPIAAMPRTPVNNVPFLLKRVVCRHRRYESGGWPIDVGNVSYVGKVKRLFPSSAWMLGFDHYTDSVENLMRILGWHVRRQSNDTDIMCSAISHPKFMGDHSFALMRGFVERVRHVYGDNVSFCTYRDVYDELFAGRGDHDSVLTRMSA